VKVRAGVPRLMVNARAAGILAISGKLKKNTFTNPDAEDGIKFFSDYH